MRKKSLIGLIRDSFKALRPSLLALGALAFMFVSCAQDGFDDESFDGGVYNTQLETPTAEDISVKSSDDGTRLIISWPLVYGAGGYHAVLTNLTTEEVVKDSIIDNNAFSAPRIEENNYELTLQVLGNTEKNNTGGELVLKAFNTFTPAFGTIPSGTDLNAFFAETTLPEQKDAIAFDLEQGGTYQLTDVLDFGNKYVVLRSTGTHATITTSPGACFMFGNGIKLQNIDIDATDNTANGLLLMSNTPDESLSIEALGYKDKGANQTGFVMTNPVTLKNVNVKGLKKSLIYGNKTNWSLLGLMIDGCMVQLDNEESMGVINMSGAKNGLIKSMTVCNSTFYNLKKNSTAYFLRYGNSSNAQPRKIFGNGETAVLTLTNNTFANVFTDKDFANNLANTDAVTTILTDNIFYDVYRVYQFVQTNTKRTARNNFVWWVNTPKQTNDITRTDSNGNPLCTEADPGFPTIDALTPMDLSQPNGGANFVPSGLPLENRAGDPRWLPTE